MLRRLFARPGPLVYGTMVVGTVLDAEGIKTETFSETIFGVALAMRIAASASAIISSTSVKPPESAAAWRPAHLGRGWGFIAVGLLPRAVAS